LPRTSGIALIGRLTGNVIKYIMQRILIIIGAGLLLVGLLWPWLSRLGLGRLPGDVRIETENGVFYFPITTCVIISVVISLVLWFIRR
jgi:hypothetical protein